MGQELAGTAVNRRRQVEMRRRMRDYIEEVIGGWLFAHTSTGREKFEAVGKREWVLENSTGR